MRFSIIDRFFRRSKIEQKPQTSSEMFEPLEKRTLLSGATVTSVTADNRGEVLITLSAPVVAANVNKTSVQMYGVGPDKILGTADDVRIPASVRWTASNNRITIEGEDVAPNSAYRVKLVASRMRDASGTPIDGDFNGTFPAGNHKAGGNFEFQVKNDTSAAPLVRMSTSAGVITIAVRKDLAPITVKNFLRYTNDGLYDSTIFHRDGRTDFNNGGPISIIQAGAFTGTDLNDLGLPTEAIPAFSPISLEAALKNNRGTIAMARGSAPNTADNSFFFNVDNNNFLDATGPNTGFCAFGSVSASSLAVIDAIFNAPTVAPNAGFNSVPQIGGADVVIRRVAVLMKVAPLT